MNELKRLVFSSLTLFFICIFFLTPSASALSDGEWSGITNEGGDVSFIISGNYVQDFKIVRCLTGGLMGHGCLEAEIDPDMLIIGSSFGFDNSIFELTGTFTSSNTCIGTWDEHSVNMGYGSGTWTASGPSAPYITFSPSNKEFGRQLINTTSQPVIFTLRNIGGGIAKGSVTLTGANADQFEIASGGESFLLSQNQSKDIYVRFAPRSEGLKQAALLANGDSPCNDVSVSFSGTGSSLKIMPWITLLLLDDGGDGEDPHPQCPVILNGDFESGATIWMEYSALGYDLITSDFYHSGSYGAWLGGGYNETLYIQQQITVPSACPFLSFYHGIVSEDACGYDYGYVRINGVNLATLNLCESENTNGWVENRINISSYAGQTVTLQFRAQTDETLNSNWFIDDVSFQSTD